MIDPTHSANPNDADGNNDNAPKRYIYNQADMEHFRHSPARKELLQFVSAMGRGLTNTLLPHGGYNPSIPLKRLTPALASLHGSLSCMSNTWMDPNQDGIPPDLKVKARFGNPAFRTWHARLVERSYGMVRCLMACHVKHSSFGENDELAECQILKECSAQGYLAASSEGPSMWEQPTSSAESSSKQEEIIAELREYLHLCFGHPMRIDYGTGHECSFIVFLLSLCKIGCFGSGGMHNKDENGGDNKSKPAADPEAVSLACLSLFYIYLNVTRGLQRDYMLEPAGSHGVWGLDDYHCVPFYLGACQMIAREQWQQKNMPPKKRKGSIVDYGSDNDAEEEAAKRMPDTPYLTETTSRMTRSASIDTFDTHSDNHDHWEPSIIHDRRTMEIHRPAYLYLSCINFIQQIKPSVPFSESSPMLNDISNIGNWTKVSSGLLRLFEGEVLDKMPVVQHFVFGKIFSANWSPSRKAPLEAPKSTFINRPAGEECRAPWAHGRESVGDSGASCVGNAERRPASNDYAGGMPPTRAPWAK